MKLNIENIYRFVTKDTVFRYKDEVQKHSIALHNKTGKGSDFLGWVNLPSSVSEQEIGQIEETAKRLQDNSEVVVVVGIGGSYLGARAVIEALSHNFEHLKKEKTKPIILYAGQNLSQDYLYELTEILKDRSFSVIVISKSGTTTEPAVAFRILKDLLEKKHGRDDAAKRIIAITDRQKGALKKLADKEGYKTFVIPDDVGGRYSVLTPVGLLPIAAAGFSIRELLKGASQMEKITGQDNIFEDNPAAIYSAARNALYNHGKTTEILVNYNPKLYYFTEWWKQLFGESEGKEGKGIFPAGVNNTTDLHSMGQWIQEGQRNIFETVVSVKEAKNRITIPSEKDNTDNLNYLAGRQVEEVNKKAEQGTIDAHVEGGVPNIHIEVEKLNEYCLGELLYFFEKACAISGYILGVNPFDQPGVEVYKRNMFGLLGKP